MKKSDLLRYFKFYDGTYESVDRAIDCEIPGAYFFAWAEELAYNTIGTDKEASIWSFWRQCGSPGRESGLPEFLVACLWEAGRKGSDNYPIEDVEWFETINLPTYISMQPQCQ